MRGGFGYVLFVSTWPIIYYLYKKVIELYDKRYEDNQRKEETFLGALKDLTNAVSNLQKGRDADSATLQAIREKILLMRNKV